MQRLNTGGDPVTQVASIEGAIAVASAITPPAATVVPAPLNPSDSLMLAATSSDGITWTPAVARTWVNVRNEASRGGDVVGVIKPASRAVLGTDRAGWRQVRSSDAIGWVDPRLFEPDSLRTRGL